MAELRLTEFRDKLREMVKPPVPTIDEVERVVRNIERTTNVAMIGSANLDILRRHVASLREEEAADTPSEEPEFQVEKPRKYLSGDWVYEAGVLAGVVGGEYRVFFQSGARRIATGNTGICGPYASLSDAQAALDKHAKEHGWELVT